MVRFGLIAGLLMFAMQGAAGPIKKELQMDMYKDEDELGYYSMSCTQELACLTAITYRESREFGEQFTIMMSVGNFLQRSSATQKASEAKHITKASTRLSFSNLAKTPQWHDRCDVIINRSFKASGALDPSKNCEIQSEPLVMYLISDALDLDQSVGRMEIAIRTYEDGDKSNSANYEFHHARFNPTLPQKLLETFGTTDLFKILETELGVILQGSPQSGEAYFEYIRPEAS